MTNKELATLLSAKVFNEGEEKEIQSWYVGDLLSFVMGNAPQGAGWFTIMSNVNVLAVATLIDCACVILCEGVQPDEALINRAKQQDVCLLGVTTPIYETITGLLKK